MGEWIMEIEKIGKDFSLVGILAKIANLLAKEKISIFVVSTFHTDYIFVKKEDERNAVNCLQRAGYRVF